MGTILTDRFSGNFFAVGHLALGTAARSQGSAVCRRCVIETMDRRSTVAFRRFSLLGRVALLASLVASLGLLGCVQRRMTIRSNPPGAVVYVDDYEIGTTPVSTNFTYYGTRKIRLTKNGYETLTVMQPVPPPWYQFVPLDFVTENLIPGEIRDHRTFDYQLVPQAVVPTEQLLERAEALRRQTRGSGGTPATQFSGANTAWGAGGLGPGTLPAPPQVLPPPARTDSLFPPPVGAGAPQAGPSPGSVPGAGAAGASDQPLAPPGGWRPPGGA